MPLTSEEITNKIDIFLNQVSQKYLMKAEQSSFIESPVEQANIKEKFKKLIFAETKEYAETVGTLVPTDLILEAQQLRLLRIGMEINSSNNSKTRIGLDCFQELSQVLSINSVSKGLEHKLAYVALAYYLSNGGKEQEALDYFIKVRNVFKEGGFLPFNILEPSFVKLYYSFCIILSSWRSQNTEAHTAYDDLPLSDRLGNGTCELVIDMAVRAVSDMPWIDLQDKIAIITAYQMLSAKCYAEEQFCDPIYLKKAVDFATTSVEQIMALKNLIAMGHKYGETKEARQRASKEMMALLFPETAAREAARQAEREAFIKEAKQRLEYLDEFLKNSLKQSEEYRKTAEQHARNVINDWAVAAKKEANHRSYQNLKIKGAVMAATYVLVPYVAPVIAPAISSIAGGLGVSAAAATTIGTTLAPAISKAVISTTLDAMVNDDYKHLGKNILKSAAINAVPAGAGLIVNVGDASTKAVEMMKQAAVNMSKGATEAAFNHGNILQGTFIAAASGAVSDKISKALPTEVGHIAALEPAIFSGVQEATTSLVTGKGDPLVGGLHKAAETFVINQMGNSLRAGITAALPPINNPTNAAFHKVKEKSDKEILTDENSTKTKQQNAGRKKLSSSKLRAEDRPQSSNQSSSSTTSLSKISRVPSTLSQSDERAAHRQANNLRWLEQLELFSGGLEHFTSQGQASSSSWKNDDFDLESMLYNSQSKMILNLYQQHKVGVRAMGAMQAGTAGGSQPIPPQSSFTSSVRSSVLDFFMPAAYADDLSLPPYKPSTFTDSSNSSYLDVGFGEKLLILTGGGMKYVWSGIEQGYYMAGERLGILAPGTVTNYTNQRNQEMQLYNSTPAGQSKLRPYVEFGTEMLLYSVVPGAVYGRIGLVANAALSGGVIGGLQFVDDGQASSRFINIGAGAVVGAGVGVAVNKVGGSLLKLYDARQSRKFNHYVSEVGFGSEEKLTQHFSKHGTIEFKGTYNNSLEYLEGARDVMRYGYKVEYPYTTKMGVDETRIGYVKFMGNTNRRSVEEIIQGIPKTGKHPEGTMKFEFVGTNLDGEITTYFTPNSKDLFYLLNGNKFQKEIIQLPKVKPT